MICRALAKRDRNFFLNLITKATNQSHLRQTHAQIILNGLNTDLATVTKLVQKLSDLAAISDATLICSNFPNPDLFLYNVIIRGFSRNNNHSNSLFIYRQLRENTALKPDNFTYAFVISAASKLLQLQELKVGMAIECLSIKLGFHWHAHVLTGLISLYAKCGDMSTGERLFEQIKHPDIIAYNAMISGFNCNQEMESAIALFRELLVSHQRVNSSTMLGALSLGKWVHDLASKENFKSNIYVSTALIDMYAKCGSIEEARQVFDTMPEKNAVTWNAMISGYGLHGHAHEALQIFDKMVDSKVPLSGVSFVSVLYACSHAGLVKEGEEIFYAMVQDHGFEPLSEHYACMVDLLGRAGELQKALDFIKKMPIEPGPAIWGALLSACKTHKNTELARLASDKLFELDPENVGYHVLLSNIHTADKNYDEAASVRQVVKNRNLAKTPGCTLIEIDKIPHVFTSGQRSHQKTEAIYGKLEKLMGKMREAGYQTDTMTALHDVEEEEKELMVKVHSEKLAIAYGLMNTKRGSEIRIIKNLRVCIDCHNFTKFISKITERVIVVRDANRFHHFKDGQCSCGDYW
ncbi:Pentatricopeptide repeat-containing protein [Cynara cardunculus var. scolymus]|uniref:Pentatricopeptide repeat-containing protein n=1 Tax=Cynara cardunculus var. scolymus TaxID=59895 RepID=A0A103Y2M6_CYNCS|nr:Pentatricopeptide repeat-containing protein [Cynara cardunculus var. scolymus]